MPHDLIIRNGLVVDGTGSTPYLGDVAIDAGRIAAVVPAAASAADRALGDAQSEFDARGCGVTPGEMLRA